jgi:DNA-directed RNA polymerase specialized sigma24 family protein
MILAMAGGCGWALAPGSDHRVDSARAGERNGGGARMALEEELAALMAAAQGGDAAAYRALLKACLPVVAAIARSQGARGEAVDDVVQDTLMTVHRARASYDPARPFLPWLRAITQRRAIDRLRRASRRPREVNDPLAYEAEADPGPAPEQGLEARDRDRPPPRRRGDR